MIFSGFGAKNIHLKNPIDFLFTFWPIIKQTFNVQKNVEGLEWPAIDALHIGYHRFSVTSMVMNPQVKTCFVNKQLTYYLCCYYRATSPSASKHYIGCPEPLTKYFQWGWRFRGYLFPQPGVGKNRILEIFPTVREWISPLILMVTIHTRHINSKCTHDSHFLSFIDIFTSTYSLSISNRLLCILYDVSINISNYRGPLVVNHSS